MEPAAPGTEDDVVDYNSLNKKETENDRLLSIKAVLKNGSYDTVFQLSYVNGSEHWFCRVCECPIMGRVYQHELGRRHSQNMSATYGRKRYDEAAASSSNADNKIQQSSTVDVDDDNMIVDENVARLEVAPGEPVPPGFEGEITRRAQIQDRLDGFKVGPLVALEYLIEMNDYDVTKEPSYLCILCDKKGDPRTVLTHLASYNHISQYLQKHFPSCYRTLAPYMTKQYKRNWQMVLQKIAEAIEKKFGRLKPFCIEQDKFERDRLNFLTMISKGMHFSELNGPSFVELVVHDELVKTFDDDGRIVKANVTSFGGKPFIEREPIKPVLVKRSPSPPVVARPTKKSSRIPSLQGKRKSKSPRSRRRSLSSISSISSNEDVKRPRNRSPPKDLRDERRRGSYSRQSPSPRRRYASKADDDEEKRKNKEKEKLQKVDEYNKLSRAIENDIEKALKQFEKNPEKHPKYNDEWKLFWNKRYKELQSEGKDASKYDFKPEWIEFWGKRVKELSNDELKTRKEGLRKRLGLGEEPTPISFRIGPPTAIKSSSSSSVKDNKPTPMASRPDSDPEVIIVEDNNPAPKKNSLRDRDRSHSPWESDTTPPATFTKSRRSRSPPEPDKRRINRIRIRSRERSRSFERIRRSVDRSSRRSPEKLRRSSPLMRSSRDRRSRSRDSFKSSVYHGRDRDKDYYRERDLRERERELDLRERSWEKGVRESSFERDVRGRERIRTVAELPWEREKLMYGHHPSSSRIHEDYYAPPAVMRDVRPGPNYVPPVIDDEPDDVNIVSILRLLTALEEKLGSLGPKIIDLLAQALAMEKKEANSSETLLDNEINCVMFETVKEKLKGQLLAGLVDPLQERAFKKAIQKTANLIHLASQRKKQQIIPGQSAVAVPGVGAVDKAAIAKQLANALIEQGKTDVTQAELEQLINAVVGMAEASKGSNKPMTTASFLAQLTGESSSKSNPPEPKEKIIIPRVGKQIGISNQEKHDSWTPLEDLTEPLSPGTPERSSGTSNMENLSDSDLQTLLQNFKDLSTEEQMNLINYLKKLELNEPERVERLRKFVNLGPEKPKETIDLDKEISPSRNNGRKSPFSNRMNDLNPELKSSKTNNDKVVGKIHVDSEDEEYSFEDVVKAASKNVKQKEMEDNRKIVEESIVYSSAQKVAALSDAKTLITNLMSSLNSTKTSSSSGEVNLLGLPTSCTNTLTSSISSSAAAASSSDFATALSGINIDNLTKIVNNVQRTHQHQQQQQVHQQQQQQQQQQQDTRFNNNYPGNAGSNFSCSSGNSQFAPQNRPNSYSNMHMQQRPTMSSSGQQIPSMMNSSSINQPGIVPAPTGYPPQRVLAPNQFGNPSVYPLNSTRPVSGQFNANYPRFSAPRAGFNNNNNNNNNSGRW